MSVREIEVAVARLTPEELGRFAEWFERYMADEWDRQIEADAKAGRLDALIHAAEADIAGVAGVVPTPERSATASQTGGRDDPSHPENPGSIADSG